MDNEMIERCMDAVDKLQHHDFNNAEREQIVLAVIKAMREPTEKMALPAYEALDKAEPDSTIGPNGLLAIYHAMIDSILNDR